MSSSDTSGWHVLIGLPLAEIRDFRITISLPSFIEYFVLGTADTLIKKTVTVPALLELSRKDRH